MTQGPLLVWGTCWFDESASVLASVLREVKGAAHALGLKVEQVIFDARHDRQSDERVRLSALTSARLLIHDIDAYPNKNLGVAMISAHAVELGAEVLAIVDADWAFDDISQFVQGLIGPVLAGHAVGVLPDIRPWAGRANRLIGEPAMLLFRSEMGRAVRTPFPGAVAAVPEVLADVTTSGGYHYDWGGEWNIAEGLWLSGRVVCPELGMVNVRHRTTQSKAGDAFQIWRAILGCDRQVNAAPMEEEVTSAAMQLGIPTIMERLQGSASEQLAAFRDTQSRLPCTIAATVGQLAPMVIAPLALLLDGEDTRFHCFSSHDAHAPYDRAMLDSLSILAAASARSALVGCTRGSRTFVPESGGSLGSWDSDRVAAARILLGK